MLKNFFTWYKTEKIKNKSDILFPNGRIKQIFQDAELFLSACREKKQKMEKEVFFLVLNLFCFLLSKKSCGERMWRSLTSSFFFFLFSSPILIFIGKQKTGNKKNQICVLFFPILLIFYPPKTPFPFCPSNSS